MSMQSGYIHQQQPPHHPIDEKEALLLWLKSEFAAANAMIDALCHHLRAFGDPGEYEVVIASVQQRRCNWNSVLQMQQYFPISDVIYSLQHVGWKRHQWAMSGEGSARTSNFGKEFRRGGRGYRGGFEAQNYGRGSNGRYQSNGHLKGNGNLNEKVDTIEKEKLQEKDEKNESDGTSEGNAVATSEEMTPEAVSHEDGSPADDGSGLVSNEKQKASDTPKTFVSNEIHDGTSVNISEGMKLYEDLFDSSEISKLNTLVNDLRASGKNRELQDPAFVLLKRPMKGHGREMIQLGIPTADAPVEDDAESETPKDTKTVPIPEELQHVIEHLLTKEVVNIKPDSIIIDIFNEGDHSQPYSWPQWFGRPVCLLFLTECNMSFGKVFTTYHPGEYRGALNLSLHSGDVLVMEGKSADFARHAIPSIRKQRILVTLVKSLPKKGSSGEVNRAHVSSPPSTWSRRSSLLPTPNARSQLHPSNGIHPVFVPSSVAIGLAFPTPVSTVSSPRLLLPGTGVFLPPNHASSEPDDSGNSSDVQVAENGACNGSVSERDEA